MLKEDIDQDIILFFSRIEGLKHSDKKAILRIMLNKYALLSTSDCLLDRVDLLSITSKAKRNMATDSGTVYLGEDKRKLSFEDLRIKAIAESVIMTLNGKECFKRLPRFDVRDNLFKDGDV